MSDEYMPAISMPTESEAPPPIAASQPVPDIEPGAVDSPDESPRAQRVISDKTRAMFRQIAERVSKEGMEVVSDDLVPMGQDEAAPAARAPAAAPAAVATPNLALPVLNLPPPAQPQQDAARTLEDQRRALAIELREKEIEARSALLAEREKTLPSRERLAESPAETITSWLRDTFGAVDDNELKTLVSDVMSEVSEKMLGAKLPEDIKAQLEGRRAVRSVKAYKASLDAREKSLADQRTAQEKTAREDQEKRDAQAQDQVRVKHIGDALAPHSGTFRFLHDPVVTGGLAPGVIVNEVYKEQERQFRAGTTTQQPDLAAAARFADDYYKAQAEAAAKRAGHFQTLLAPAALVAPVVKPAISPGAVPGPTAKTPATTQAIDADPSDTGPMDRQERRRQSLAKLRASRLGGA